MKQKQVRNSTTKKKGLLIPLLEDDELSHTNVLYSSDPGLGIKSDIILTTEPRVNVTRSTTCGIVAGQTLYGINILKEIVGWIQDIIGGKLFLFERDLGIARKRCIEQMIKQAKTNWPQCNAIVNIQIDIVALGGALGVITTGTAVYLDMDGPSDMDNIYST
jgi:uncharacterized protein YbjQ (UPF0145 family)